MARNDLWLLKKGDQRVAPTKIPSMQSKILVLNCLSKYFLSIQEFQNRTRTDSEA